jgi:exosortase E/protease (VPEID-CTERM system)
VAAGGFHSQAGWLAFNAVGLGTVALGRRHRFFRATSGPSADAVDAGPSPTVAHLAPLMAIVAASMIGAAFSAGPFDPYYPARVVAAVAAFWACRRADAYRLAGWTWAWTPVAIGAVVFGAWMLLEPADPGGSRSAAIARGLGRLPPAAAGAWLAARVVGSAVTVPIAEELAFRGYLARRLVRADFAAVGPGQVTALALLVSSLLFGAMHGRWLAGTLAGLAYGACYLRRGSVADAAIAHATTNALIDARVLATGDWSLWA